MSKLGGLQEHQGNSVGHEGLRKGQMVGDGTVNGGPDSEDDRKQLGVQAVSTAIDTVLKGFVGLTSIIF